MQPKGRGHAVFDRCQHLPLTLNGRADLAGQSQTALECLVFVALHKGLVSVAQLVQSKPFVFPGRENVSLFYALLQRGRVAITLLKL